MNKKNSNLTITTTANTDLRFSTTNIDLRFSSIKHIFIFTKLHATVHATHKILILWEDFFMNLFLDEQFKSILCLFVREFNEFGRYPDIELYEKSSDLREVMERGIEPDKEFDTRVKVLRLEREEIEDKTGLEKLITERSSVMSWVS
ncbi:leucine-rich repeat disease resistance protein precursor [Trifolium repens]|nr:leucine-rich repeat disease resistance protein precursor [Trifolium repens]